MGHQVPLAFLAFVVIVFTYFTVIGDAADACGFRYFIIITSPSDDDKATLRNLGRAKPGFVRC